MAEVLRTRAGIAVSSAEGLLEGQETRGRENAAVVLAILADRQVAGAAAALAKAPPEIQKHAADAMAEMKPWSDVGPDVRSNIEKGVAALLDALTPP